MTPFLSLVRAGLKSNFGLSILWHRLFREKKDIWLGVLILLAVIGVLPALYYLVLLLQNAYLLLKPLGQERALLTLGIVAGQMFILLFGLYYVISAFYFSRDLEMLIPLPLKPFQVMTSKFIVILVNEYLTVIAIVLPPLLTFGVMARAGLPYWTTALLVYAFLPVIPLAIVSLLVVAMMRIVNFGRKKDVLILAGSLVLIAIGMTGQMAMSRYSGAKPDAEALASFFASPDSLLNRVGAGFPPSIWATKAIALGHSPAGLFNLALYLGTSLVLFILMVVLSEKLFYSGLVGLGEVAGKKRILSRGQISRRVSSGRHPVRAIFAREWRIMNRTPIFLLNGVLVVIIVPVVFIIIARSGGGGGDNAFLLAVMLSAKPFHKVLATAAFLTVCGSLNGTSSSTFSREGGQFWLSKVIPVSPREQVTAKFFHSYLVSFLGVASASVVAGFIFHTRPTILAASAALALAAAFVLTAVGMIIDLARPLLDWTNPQKAIKQNLNVLLAFLANIGILTALGFTLNYLFKTGLDGDMILFALFGVLAALSFGSFRILAAFAEKRYRDIEP